MTTRKDNDRCNVMTIADMDFQSRWAKNPCPISTSVAEKSNIVHTSLRHIYDDINLKNDPWCAHGHPIEDNIHFFLQCNQWNQYDVCRQIEKHRI